jgi:EamA domain-containing membrane protein RarD
VLIFGEAFTRTQFAGFGLVWAALILFTIENFWARRQATLRLTGIKLLTKNE